VSQEVRVGGGAVEPLERELSGTLAQTLRYQPGSAVRFNGPAAAMPVMRGLTGDRVLIL
jgi:iron complex outermembrane receptor protein